MTVHEPLEEQNTSEVAPAEIDDRNIIRTPQSFFMPLRADDYFLPYPATIAEKPLQDDGILRYRVGKEKPIYLFPHHLLKFCNVHTSPDRELYSQMPPRSSELAGLGVTNKDIIKLEELSAHLFLSQIFDLEFPLANHPSGIYTTEHFMKVARSRRSLDFVSIFSGATDVLEIGGQHGRVANSLLNRHHRIKNFDIIDKFVPAIRQYEQFKRNKKIRIISGDALNMEKISESLTRGGFSPLAQYNVTLSNFVLNHTFDPIGIFNELWNHTKIGGYILSEDFSFNKLIGKIDLPSSYSDALNALLILVRSADSVESWSETQWQHAANVLDHMRGRRSEEITILKALEQFDVPILGAQFRNRYVDIIQKTTERSPFADRKLHYLGTGLAHGDAGRYTLQIQSTL